MKSFKIWKDWLVAFALTFAFVAQKLTNQISWNWWEVTSPIWMLAGIYVVLFLIVFIWYKVSNIKKK